MKCFYMTVTETIVTTHKVYGPDVKSVSDYLLNNLSDLHPLGDDKVSTVSIKETGK